MTPRMVSGRGYVAKHKDSLRPVIVSVDDQDQYDRVTLIGHRHVSGEMVHQFKVRQGKMTFYVMQTAHCDGQCKETPP